MSDTQKEEQHQGRFKNTKKNTRNAKTTKKKTINNTIEKEIKGGFDSLKVAPRERKNTKGGLRTRGRTTRSSRPPRRIPLTTQ